MVHKNDKWNISDKRGEEIAHKYIIDILKDSKNNTIPLSELVSLLNHQTKHIKFTNHNKKKPIYWKMNIKQMFMIFVSLSSRTSGWPINYPWANMSYCTAK